MTDKDKLIALLREFGINASVESDFGRCHNSDNVLLEAGQGGVDGYNGFYAEFKFDDSGKFVEVGVWE
jgi:hypothetical protein